MQGNPSWKGPLALYSTASNAFVHGSASWNP